jgi:hypothetical protein
MQSLFPLIKTVVNALAEDGMLASYLGGTSNVFAMQAPETQAYPFITVSPVSAIDWSAGNFDGDDIQFRVAAHFKRGGPNDNTGLLDVSQACERIRDVLTHRDGFNLEQSPSEGESLVLDALSGPVRINTATDKRLVSCRYVSGNIIPGLNDDAEGGSVSVPASISGVLTFRALISPAN